MILTTLTDCQRIEHLHPLLKPLFDYVKTHDLRNAPLGRIEIDGDNLFINNSIVDAVKRENQTLEMHRRYMDVHILLQGTETIGWKPSADIQHICTPYNPEADFEMSDDTPSTYITLTPGQVLIAYPEDAHAPIIGEGKIRKLIGKVRI